MHFPSFRIPLAALLAASLALAGCGGGSSNNGSTTIRLVNATTDVTALNLALTTSTSLSNVGLDSQSDTITVGAATYTTVLSSGTTTTSLLSSDRTLAGGTDYTAIAWGNAASLKLATLSDTSGATDAPVAGSASLRVFNTASDAGALDVYLTAATTDLTTVGANVSGIAAGALTSYNQFTQGTYRLRITGAGDNTDIRLDLPNLTLANQARVTLVIEPGSGGVLVNALQVVYQSPLSTLKNTQARVRMVASVNGNGTVTGSLGGTSLNVGLRSPSVGNYTLVPAGTAQALAVSVNGTAQTSAARQVAAGADYTLLVSGDPASPQLSLLTDDNRLPTSATRAKLRLVNGALGQDGLTLAVDFSAVASSVAYGTASAYGSSPANSAATIEVSSPLAALPLYSTASSTVNVAAQGVYTVFMLGGGAVPTGVLRKDR